MKIKYLYHGSVNKIIGSLSPKQPEDLANNPENLIKGVCATDIKNLAIAMALISCKGVYASGIEFDAKKAKGIIYRGWPKQERFFLYTLPVKYFKQSKGQLHQFICKKEVTPVQVEELKVSDYIHLIGPANEKEKEVWRKKYPKVKI